MDYSKVIDLDNITLYDCLQWNETNGYVVINDGRIVNLVKNEKENK